MRRNRPQTGPWFVPLWSPWERTIRPRPDVAPSRPATDLGGYVESVSTDGDRTATVVLRVPADRYDAALAVLRERGEVMSLRWRPTT